MPFTDHEVEELRRIVGELDAVNSNGSFARYTVEHLRALRDGDVSVVDTHARSLANKALNILNAIKEAI